MRIEADKISEKLCIKSELLGLCHPTESMIAEAIDNALSNQQNEVDYELRSGGFDKAADYLDRQRELEIMESREQ